MSDRWFCASSLQCKPTAQDFDAHGMQVVLCTNARSHSNNEEISKAGNEGHDPDGHS